MSPKKRKKRKKEKKEKSCKNGDFDQMRSSHDTHQ
jgi:hypothetical protein